jgi:hypothetical protein
MINRIDQAIETENEAELQNCIAALFDQTAAIEKIYYPKIEKLMLERWHHQHEEIVALIWLRQLRDNRFVEPIMLIASGRALYRPFDDEMESTLRKCVHALKIIATEQSDTALRKLVDTGNENVRYTLKNYS